MTAVVLPVVALAALTVAGPLPAELIARPTGPVHLYAPRRPQLRDFTPSGALRTRTRRPVCGQRATRWYLAVPDSRPLCRRCAAWAGRHLNLTVAPVTVDELVDVLLHTTSLADVDAAQRAALATGLVARRVPHPDRRYGQVPLHTLIAHTRSRLTPARVGVVEHAWLERVMSRRTRFPRRIA